MKILSTFIFTLLLNLVSLAYAGEAAATHDNLANWDHLPPGGFCNLSEMRSLSSGQQVCQVLVALKKRDYLDIVANQEGFGVIQQVIGLDTSASSDDVVYVVADLTLVQLLELRYDQRILVIAPNKTIPLSSL